MNKYENNALVEEMDPIILLNDNYADQGLYKGYIGTVMSNFIEKYGFVVADFFDPVGSIPLQPVIEIKKEDFRVLSGSREDKRLAYEFRELFRKLGGKS